MCLQEASLKGCTLQLVIQHCTLAVLATNLLSMYMYLEHSYSEYCNLIGQGVVYKSHINHETWLISARGTYKPRRPSPHVQCPYIATT